MQVIIKPTADCTMLGDVMCRIWRGENTETGSDVIALICAIKTPDDLSELALIPPPDPRWADDVREAMGELWQITHLLSASQARTLLYSARAAVGLAPEVRP